VLKREDKVAIHQM